MSLTWRGPQVTSRLQAAQIAGVNATMAAAVRHAKSNHEWQNRSGALEGGIDVVDYAHADGKGVTGTWGTRDVRYALIHELGGTIKPVQAKALAFEIDGQFIQVQSVTIPARPYLRPAADAEYPKLPRRIRTAFKRGGGGRAS